MTTNNPTLGGGAAQSGTAAPGSSSSPLHPSSEDELAFLRARISELEARVAMLERPVVVHDLRGPMSLLRDIGEEVSARQSDSDWVGSPFAAINQLKPDHSGKVGELFVKRMCDGLGVACVYDEDINDQEDGTYDVLLNDKRVEIKTARLGKQKGFQHESLRADGCDYYMFLDITSECFYVTVCEKFDMSRQHPVLGRKPHLRKGASDVYKLDFSEANLLKGIANGITLKVTNEVTMEGLISFLMARIV